MGARMLPMARMLVAIGCALVCFLMYFCWSVFTGGFFLCGDGWVIFRADKQVLARNVKSINTLSSNGKKMVVPYFVFINKRTAIDKPKVTMNGWNLNFDYKLDNWVLYIDLVLNKKLDRRTQYRQIYWALMNSLVREGKIFNDYSRSVDQMREIDKTVNNSYLDYFRE